MKNFRVGDRKERKYERKMRDYKLWRRFLSLSDKTGVQNQENANRYRKLGAKRVISLYKKRRTRVIGRTKKVRAMLRPLTFRGTPRGTKNG